MNYFGAAVTIFNALISQILHQETFLSLLIISKIPVAIVNFNNALGYI